MSKWKEYKILDLLEQGLLIIGDGYRAKNVELSASRINGLPFARAGNINGGFDFNEADYFPTSSLNRVGEKISKVGDVVFTSKGTVGRFAFVGDQSPLFVYSPQLCFWRSLDQDFIFPRFLLYWMQSREFYEQADAVKSQTDMADYVNLSDQRKMKITLPEINEQRAIASILSSLDDKIDLLHRQNATLEKMAETLFRQWFVPACRDEHGAGREEAKEDWENCVLEDLCTQINSGGTPSTKVESYYNGSINWYSTKELNDNYLFVSNSRITEEGLNNSSAKLFPKGTVLIAIYAAPTVGRLGILANEATFNQAACGLVADENKCCKEFLYLYLKNQRDELNAMASGSAQQNLNVGKIKNYPAFIPDFNTMTVFKANVIQIFNKIETNTSQIRTLTTLRDTLLPKLMSGEVRVFN